MFSIWKGGIFCSGTEIKELRGGVRLYAAQSRPQIDTARAKKDPFRIAVALCTALFIAGSARAFDDEILGFRIVSRTAKELVVDVTYSYSGSHGDHIFIGAFPADNRIESRLFAYKPAEVSAGIHTVQVQMKSFRELPVIFTTRQFAVFMYEGGGKSFLERYYDYDMNWF
jgi:hypothetical protein